MSPKQFFLSWLARSLSEERRRLDFASQAVLGEGVVFGEGSSVENSIGPPNRIAIGNHSYIRGRLLTYGHGGRIRIGSWCYIGARSEIWSMASIEIGNRVLISHGVNVHDGTAHSLDADERHAHFKRILEHGHPKTATELPGIESAPVVIEDDVWISFNVTILKGVRIGARSVIAANSLVTKDVPPGSLYRCEVKPVITPLRAEDRDPS